MKKIDVEKKYTKKQFIEKIRRLADTLEKEKTFIIQVNGKRLNIPSDATVTIEHEREGGDEEIEFQLKWKHD
ncbi:MAG: amphi-Trp domain-containing protein [Candidatus Magasanikbacteria bacterium RIFCSPLOWO2_02_FULL_44_11]|uniref:Amphi-Trp domain-containing protein n=2 Tax=Candidatus Magasanikiibacteriota TaxID=1752731 RepID=A0A1F6N902_9BACT|nr:MAG: amphi-Trp domain-containing protein [Candidatus Magasanikbacteria bacterium RIFCSPHIGHO2_02_FULL_45_10]OGH80435.1 MAG: amphi-Trp domain-containing protein [Candidatus Magasanikbacteria bacterium RIFCSPLOWO2_02_FULL_44_11]